MAARLSVGSRRKAEILNVRPRRAVSGAGGFSGHQLALALARLGTFYAAHPSVLHTARWSVGAAVDETGCMLLEQPFGMSKGDVASPSSHRQAKPSGARGHIFDAVLLMGTGTGHHLWACVRAYVLSGAAPALPS